MYGLPPHEIASIDSSKLEVPSSRWFNFFTQIDKKLLFSALPLSFTDTKPSFPSRVAFSLSIALIPIAFISWTIPLTPQIRTDKSTLKSAIAEARQSATPVASIFSEKMTGFDEKNDGNTDENTIATNILNTLQETNDPYMDAERVIAELASDSLLSVEERSFRYHIALAQGFLRKAINISHKTNGQQTTGDQQEILTLLEEALSAANTAIDQNPTSGLGFLLRARIYTTASVAKPDLAQKGQQDLTIARALGVENVDILNEDVYSTLPTQQANNIITDPNAPIIADAEEGNQAVLNTQTSDNLTQGKITLPAGEVEIFVPFTTLTNDMNIAVEISTESNYQPHTPLRVSSRRMGEGFTIQSFNQLDQDVIVSWRITQ